MFRFRLGLLGITAMVISALLVACGGDDFGTQAKNASNNGSQNSGASQTNSGASQTNSGSLPDELADFPLPDAATVNCPCSILPDSRKTLAVLVTTPVAATDVIALLDEKLEPAGYMIKTREVNGPKAALEFTKDGVPGTISVFPNAGGQTSLSINLFTSGGF
jgi:hypothetical protein